MTLCGHYNRLTIEVAKRFILVVVVTLALFLLTRLFHMLLAGYVDFQRPPWRKVPAFTIYTAALYVAPMKLEGRGLVETNKRNRALGIDAMLPDSRERWILSISLIAVGLIVEYLLG